MAYTVVYTPSKINFNFNKGEVSHIGIFYIDLSDNSIEFTKLDDGLAWTTEELDEELKIQVEKVIRKNDKSNYKTITWNHGLGNAELKVKKKTAHYTFN